MNLLECSINKAERHALALFMISLMTCVNAFAQDFWKPAGRPGTGHVYSLAINREGHVFAGTGGSGVFRSIDEGASWSAVNSGLLLNLTAVNALAINEDNHLFAALTTSGYVGSGVFRSLNNGDNWARVTTSLPDLGTFALALNSSGHVFAGTSRGIIRSTDNGESWIVVEPSTFVSGIGINPFNGNIFAGTDSAGFIRSQDNGATWKNIGTGLSNRKVSRITFNAQGHIFAAISGRGVYRSRDEGESWTPTSNGLTSTSVTTLAVDHNQNLLAGTYGQGVFRSIDDGENWRPINGGLTNLQVTSFALTVDDFAFIGTEGGGVFKSSMPTTAVQTRNVEMPAGFVLEQNYPNPFNPSTTIEFSLPHAGHVTLKIYNALGEEVATLVSGHLKSGTHKAVWNANGIASGVYVLRLQSGEFSETKKLVLVR